jgi:uncharacterized protein (TIGR03382 family)
MKLRAHVVLVTLAVLAAGSEAWANDGVTPRTPVLWDDTPCILRVDRSVDAVLHLPYAIPFEDTALTPHEVEGSRTHQFFAFCRRDDPRGRLPNWISWADVDVARKANLILPSETIDPEEVLDGSRTWSECFVRVTGDDDRRPITFAAAEAGVDWDTTAVAPGVYSIAGYTYHPRFNQWSARPGVVKVHDGDADAVGPALAVLTEETITDVGHTLPIEGCVDAAPGTMLSAFHAEASGTGEPSWMAFAEDVPIDAGSFSIDFVVPDVLGGRTAMVRVDATDPSGHAYTSYMTGFVIVLEDDPEPCDETRTPCDPTMGTTGEDDSNEPPDSTSTGTQPTGTDDGTPGNDDPPRGCGCASPAPTPIAWLTVAWFAIGRRRRAAQRGGP